MALNLFGLAQDDKTNPKGMPGLPQAAIFAREFADVLCFTKPPLLAQRLLFGTLAAIAWALGYPKYSEAVGPDLSSAEGDGPTATTRAMAGALALAASLLLAFSLRSGPQQPYSPKLVEDKFSDAPRKEKP